MPPETKHDGVSSCSLEATITKGSERWHPSYDVSNRSLPHNAWFKEKLFVKEFSCRIVLLILYLNFAWWTRWAAFFIAKFMCSTWSFAEQGKVPVFRERQISQNLGDVSTSRRLFSAKAYAINAYQCISRWNNKWAPSAKWPNFPVSFCASPMVKGRQWERHVVLIRSRTSATYLPVYWLLGYSYRL